MVKLSCFISGGELAEVVGANLLRGITALTLSFIYWLLSDKM